MTFLLLCFIAVCGTPAAAEGTAQNGIPKIKVVTTLPVLKDFAIQVGGDRVEAVSLLSGLENQHTYTSRPSDILAIRKADLLVKIGLGLDNWTDHLIQNAQNPGLTVVTTSEGIPVIRGTGGESEGASIEGGDEPGNPHIWLDPENAKSMIDKIAAALIRLDPDNRSGILARQADYLKKLDDLENRLIQKVAHLKNRDIITHHDAWPYFAHRFGFKIRDTIMLQEGTEPSAKHLADLVRMIREEHIQAVVSEPQFSPRLPQLLNEETGVRVVVLTPIPGVLKNAQDYYSMIEYDVEALVSALEN